MFGATLCRLRCILQRSYLVTMCDCFSNHHSNDERLGGRWQDTMHEGQPAFPAAFARHASWPLHSTACLTSITRNTGSFATNTHAVCASSARSRRSGVRGLRVGRRAPILAQKRKALLALPVPSHAGGFRNLRAPLLQNCGACIRGVSALCCCYWPATEGWWLAYCPVSLTACA